jgi:hypothetical protein
MKKVKDFQLSELKPKTRYILAIDSPLTVKEFNVFKSELDQWLAESNVDKNSFLFIQNATVVELPTRSAVNKAKK